MFSRAIPFKIAYASKFFNLHWDQGQSDLGPIGNRYREFYFSKDNKLFGAENNHYLDGKDGNDWLYGSSENDTLVGGAGNDILYGHTGKNIYVFAAGWGQDTIMDASGIDTIDFSKLNISITINLASTSITSGLNTITWSANTLENATGGIATDRIIGNSGNNILTGGSGNDTIIGAGGNDTLLGGSGNDTYIFANSWGTDRILDTSGIDTINFSAVTKNLRINLNTTGATSGNNSVRWQPNTIEKVFGGSGNDTIVGNTSANIIHGGLGNDTITGGGGRDYLAGNNGNDNFIQGYLHGNDTLDGGSGVDTVIYQSGNAIWLNTGLKTLTDGSFTDTLHSIERIIALSGNINTIDASDEINGVTINLNTQTASGLNYGIISIENFKNIIGSDFSDTLTGDVNANTITGGAGNDTLNGGLGNDTFIQGLLHGTDTIDGGDGIDVADYSTDSVITFDTKLGIVNDGSGTDTLASIEHLIGFSGSIIDASSETTPIMIDLSSHAATGLSSGVILFDGFKKIYGGSSDDILIGDSQENIFIGQEGNDTLNGGNGNDLFVQNPNHGNDTIDGGNDFDTVDYSMNSTISFNTKQVSVYDGTSTDTLIDIEHVIASSGLSDTIDASGETTSVTINLSTQSATGLSSSSVALIEGFENIIGGSDDDSLTGDHQANVITGKEGNDTLNGGNGNDTFIQELNHGHDVIDGGGDTDTINYFTDSDITFYTKLGQVNDGVSTDIFFNIERILASSGTLDTIDASGETTSVIIDLNLQTATGLTCGVTLIEAFENIQGGSDNDLLTGDSHANHLIGNAGNDTISGGGGNDTITGGAGDDSLDGGDGDDLFIQAAFHNTDFIDGGNGTNTVDYTMDSAIIFSTKLGTVNDGLSTDTLVNIDRIIGSSNNNDVLDASGETSAVTINLTFHTASGLTSGVTLIEGFEHVKGSDFNDTITGSSSHETLEGGLGDDQYSGFSSFGFGVDIIDDTAGTDIIDLSSFATNDPGIAFHAIDLVADGGMGYIDALQIVDTVSGSILTIYNYFDNSNTTAFASNGGFGFIETLHFSDMDITSIVDIATFIT